MVSTALNYHFQLFQPIKNQVIAPKTRRRTLLILTSTTSLLMTTMAAVANAAEEKTGAGNVLDMFRMTVPEQTVDEAMSGIREHAESLLGVKGLLETESWKEAQKELRKSSSYLKQDIYTLIQSKPGIERGRLRQLYSMLFSSVSRLDYAARDKDVSRVWASYRDLVVNLNDILSSLL